MGNITGVYLNIVEEEDFFGALKSETKFYKNNAYWFKITMIYLSVVVLLVIMIWLIKRNIKKLNKIQLLDNGLKYRNKFTEFDKDSMNILNVLLNQTEVTSGEILQLVEKQQYSPAHNERIKVQKINDINLKIATLLGIQDDLITNFKSSQDRRIRLYKIKRDYFSI